MSERILVAVAWPYANGSIHLGQAAGAYLPADIFARYHRLMGNDVLMVSGSDSHGTPVTLAAENRGVSVEEVFNEYHSEFIDNWQRLGISFDLFTSTHTDNHFEVVQDMFLKLMDNGFIYKDSMMQPYCQGESRFLADRYVEGVCPNCSFSQARGDQCDNCGRTLDPQDLIDMVCKICKEKPVIKETEHFFLKLSAFEERLIDWITPQNQWRSNVRNFSLGYLGGGLHDRAITRDIEWGVPVPIEGYDDKRIYVWFEAVIGYLSASIEWSKTMGFSDRWRDFWEKDCKSYYFMGKDNIPFHTIIWPAMLMGYGNLNLPYDVPANEYLNVEGLKISTSRNWAVWLPEYLNKYEPDPLRYVLASTMPETSDSDFSWEEYVRRNNDELVATYGNLVHRVVTMSSRNFDGKVPEYGELSEASSELLGQASSKLAETANNIEACRFRQALDSAMSLARAANIYLDREEPWKKIKVDPTTAGSILWTSLTVINCLKTVLYTLLPFSSEKLHSMLGFEGSVKDNGWSWSPELLIPGQEFRDVSPLFTKLDIDIVDQETKKIGV